ncbi:MAG: hypothetical protein ACJAWQ_001156 [Paraglaciecola sp.]|jgi:hypothetical protein|uniref:DUF1415 domain-containing protein n=1 Tax=uncultured Paraglaciecola sp. TaxID=1765024 RepID=UPI0025D2C389|nr:DUF1415 domain-containing protein [uncultured Paraglaciecola sp.]
MNIPTQVSDDTAEKAVKSWINNVIVGLNFCPFAKKELERDTVRFSIFHSTQANDALGHLLDELTLLDNQVDIQTTILIFPSGFDNFEEYLDMLELANSLIFRGGYGGIYQLASFHPNYCFDGEAENDPANYTNRSPYPLLHVLRESSVEAVLRHYPQPESIPENNIAKARKLGAEFLQALLK